MVPHGTVLPSQYPKCYSQYKISVPASTRGCHISRVWWAGTTEKLPDDDSRPSNTRIVISIRYRDGGATFLFYDDLEVCYVSLICL